MRLLLDEHYTVEIARRLREAGHDAHAIAERDLVTLDDASLLELCDGESRALVTNSLRDFVPLANASDHAGLILTSPVSMPRNTLGIGRYVRELSALMAARPDERALANEVRWLR